MPTSHVLTCYLSARNAEAYISTLVVGDIRRGVDRMREKTLPGRRCWTKWLMALMTSYRDRTLAVTTEIAEEWGRLSASNLLRLSTVSWRRQPRCTTSPS
jgi:hypothetical protein